MESAIAHGSAADVTRRTCVAALQTEALACVGELLKSRNALPASAAAVIGHVTEEKTTLTPIEGIATVVGSGLDLLPAGALERYLIVAAALENVGRISALPVSETVKRLLHIEFRYYAEAGREQNRFVAGTSTFAAMCKAVSFKRFPAGQFDWEVGGISRSDVLAVELRLLPATVMFAAVRMRGLSPVFFSHLNWRRPNRSLLELEANRSYYRMARSMELQPRVKGFAACSWFRSPGTHRISPHLSWLSDVFLQSGGFVVEAGRDDPGGGVLHRSATRRQLFAIGKFHPTKGLVMWPRDAMIAWAAAHPEFDDAA